MKINISLSNLDAVKHATYGDKEQFLFYDSGKEVGEISLVLRPDGNYEVSNILVWPNFQRRGWATKMYERAFEFVKTKNKSLYISDDRTDDAKKLHKTFEQQGHLSKTGKLHF